MHLSGVQRLTLVDYPGKLACIAFTPGCNLRCNFCYNSEFVLPEKLAQIRPSFIPEGIFFRFLQSRQNALDAVVVCGGEPTIHADLPHFLGEIRALGFGIKLDTNGSNPRMLAHILSNNLVDYIAMDVKYPLDRYAELVGVDINPDLYRESIRLIMQATHIDYEFRTTVLHPWHNEPTIRSIARSIAGAKRYRLQNFIPGETLIPDLEAYAHSPESLAHLVRVAQEYLPNVVLG